MNVEKANFKTATGWVYSSSRYSHVFAGLVIASTGALVMMLGI